MTISIAIIGFGKIARDEHLPAIAANDDFRLAAVVAPGEDPVCGAPWFPDHGTMLAEIGEELDAVAICTPPSVRAGIAHDALAAGCGLLLEKPPAPTTMEAQSIIDDAKRNGLTAFTAWHSRHAPGVAPARRHLSGSRIACVDVRWCESVRKWHPGQDWVWEKGGFGVLDPGINALSIITAIVPQPLAIAAARLEMPENRATPIAAKASIAGVSGKVLFDWRQDEGETWHIRIETEDGRSVTLEDGGARLRCDGETLPLQPQAEYSSVYQAFAGAIAAGETGADLAPLELAEQILTIGRAEAVEPFFW